MTVYALFYNDNSIFIILMLILLLLYFLSSNMMGFDDKEYVEVIPNEILRKKFLSGEIDTEEYIYISVN